MSRSRFSFPMKWLALLSCLPVAASITRKVITQVSGKYQNCQMTPRTWLHLKDVFAWRIRFRRRKRLYRTIWLPQLAANFQTTRWQALGFSRQVSTEVRQRLEMECCQKTRVQIWGSQKRQERLRLSKMFSLGFEQNDYAWIVKATKIRCPTFMRWLFVSRNFNLLF